MFIPNTIHVGYQKRTDTYTGKLAYVIYTDNKGKMRKQSSWESWCDDKITKNDFKNEPISGFVLNKGVGGARASWNWNARNEYVRVYDPRNFEIEISVENLLFILQETSSIKGKGLEGEFIYAWHGASLILLPVNSSIYKKCIEFTENQSKSIKKKDLKEGYTYCCKNGEKVMYLGKHQFSRNIFFSENNEHVYRYDNGLFHATKDVKFISHLISDDTSAYADVLDEYKESEHYPFHDVRMTKVSVNFAGKYAKINNKYYALNSYYNGYNYLRADYYSNLYIELEESPEGIKILIHTCNKIFNKSDINEVYDIRVKCGKKWKVI